MNSTRLVPVVSGIALSVVMSALSLQSALAQVVVTPSPGSSFQVHKQDNTPAISVEDSGRVVIPGLPVASEGTEVLCYDNAGSLGPCAPGTAVGPLAPLARRALPVRPGLPVRPVRKARAVSSRYSTPRVPQGDSVSPATFRQYSPA